MHNLDRCSEDRQFAKLIKSKPEYMQPDERQFVYGNFVEVAWRDVQERSKFAIIVGGPEKGLLTQIRRGEGSVRNREG